MTPLSTLVQISTATSSPLATEISFPDCDISGRQVFETEVLGLINDERTAAGLEAYTIDSKLQAAARIHSTDMACNRFFSHTGSDGSSTSDRISAQGYQWTNVGENIFTTNNTSSAAPQLAVDWWMASPPNRANILDEQFTDIGIGYIHVQNNPNGGHFTIVFAHR
jgi:uncharacterized protein YkwD